MLYEVSHLHLELSSLCNARCSYCQRNFHGYPYNMGYNETNLSLADFQRIFSLQRLSKIHGATINGNFGDAVMNPETVDIVAYMLQGRPDMNIRIHTNGGARDKEFWTQLGKMGVSCLFGIDGLADTHSLYRQDTVFENVICNAVAFINAGGRAIWIANMFDHNLHQFDDMRKMSQDLGFELFEPRPTTRNSGPSYDRSGKKVFFMKSDWHYPDQLDHEFIQSQINKVTVEDYFNTEHKEIDCWAVKNRSVYIASDGHAYPCCWTGFNPQKFRNQTGLTVWNQELQQYISDNHAPTVGLDAAIEWFENLAATWHTDRQPQYCKNWCGK